MYFHTLLASLPPVHITQRTENSNEDIITTINKIVEALFVNNDDIPLLRFCRSFIKKRPVLLHDALSQNNSDLLVKFIPNATIEILQQKNDLGESFLLHAVRLNCKEIIKSLLARNRSEELIDDTDKKKNNIFHVTAFHSTSSEISDLLIDYLLKKSINIQEKFDNFNQDSQTPLQLAIYKNNLLVTKSLLKHFNTNIHEIKNRTGDNIIHLAVRHGNLAMLKYLIEDGELIDQGNQSNLTMTPIELARLLKRDDLLEYLTEMYPEEINETDKSDDD